ncbi:MAG: FtsB family cell division protein [Phyllobacterium sp.]
MWTKQKKKSRRGRLVVPVISGLFFTYFGFHAYHGEYGLYNKLRLEQVSTALEQQLAVLTAERSAFENQVRLMRDGTLEKDMLDEQVRRALNVSHPDEVTIMVE